MTREISFQGECPTSKNGLPIGSRIATVVLSMGFLANFDAHASAATLAHAVIEGDKYRITAEERSACSGDAFSYCSYTYPDEDRLLACMRQNHDNLSTGCRMVFDEGVKRRRLY